MDCDFGDELREDRTYRCLRPGCTRVRVTDFAPWQLHWPCESDAPQLPQVGVIFRGLCMTLRVEQKGGCQCENLMRLMNRLGPTGCREQREELLAELRKNYQLYDWTDKLKAAWAAVTTGLAWELFSRDPLAAMFDLAVERAEASK